MNAGSKFLGLIAVVFSITIIYRIAPEAAIVEALVLLVLIVVAARQSDRP